MLLSKYFSQGGDPYEDRYWTGSNTVVMQDGGATDEGSALKVSTVWRGVNVLSAAVATLPLAAFRRLPEGGKEPAREIPEHRIVSLQPNPAQTSFRWRQHVMGKAVLGGNYYAQKLFVGRRELSGLWPLEPSRMKVDSIGNDGALTYRYVSKTGKPTYLPQDDVVHVRGFSSDGITGVSVLDVMRDLVKQSNTAEKARTAFLRNELRPSAVFKHPKELKGAAYARLQTSLEQNYSGPTAAGKVLIIEEGMDAAPFNISSRDAQFVESESFRVEEFLRFIGVPGVLVGHADKTATFASAEAFFQSFKDHNLFPWTRNIEQELTLSLLGLQDELFFEFNLDAMLRPDSTARAAFYRTLVELGILTRNEVRELENRNPLPGLDEPLTPLNMGGPQPGPPTSPADERAAAHLRSIARRAAEAIVRKESLAFAGTTGKKGAAERFAKDPEGWRRFVSEFYVQHVALVVERMQIDEAEARDYCEAGRARLLADGVGACEGWETSRVAQLARHFEA